MNLQSAEGQQTSKESPASGPAHLRLRMAGTIACIGPALHDNAECVVYILAKLVLKMLQKFMPKISMAVYPLSLLSKSHHDYVQIPKNL